MRPWQIWTAAIVCLALVVTAFGWLSFKAIAADRAEHAAQEQAVLEEKVRLALWRMDTQLTKLLADESMRPTYNYTAALSIAPAGDAPGRKSTTPQRDFLLISPLLNTNIAEVRFHFQIDAAGNVTSPSVPTALQCDFLCPTHVTEEQIHSSEVQLSALKKILHQQNLPQQLTKVMESNSGWLAWQDDPRDTLQLSNGGVIASSNSAAWFGNQVVAVPEHPTTGKAPQAQSTSDSPAANATSEPQLANALPNPESTNTGTFNATQTQSNPQNSVKYLNLNEGYTRGGIRASSDANQKLNQQSRPSAQQVQQYDSPAQQAALPQQAEDQQQQQLQRSVSEFQQRAAYVDNSSQFNGRNWNDDSNRQAISNYWALNLTSSNSNKLKGSAPQPTIRTSRMVPLWLDKELFLVRRVMVGGDQVIQGCWLDWIVMRAELLKVISDLLPAADLQAVPSDSAEGPRVLASLPVRLNPGLLATATANTGLSPWVGHSYWLGRRSRLP